MFSSLFSLLIHSVNVHLSEQELVNWLFSVCTCRRPKRQWRTMWSCQSLAWYR